MPKKIGSLWVDDRILDAVRDNRLVVFAGAGVSMGSPSDLPSFWGLVEYIASGTGKTPGAGETLEGFLGQLADAGVAVHARAGDRLTQAGTSPAPLHRDLVRLFGHCDRIRVVTTNFDEHFQVAAKELYGQAPEVYRAPALPLGRDFQGIVHLHGCVSRVRDIILTDGDFGRAYLTEGWAPRFLLDVFRQYVVLFVGYSHNDTVMNYLARALPPDARENRFALTELKSDWSKWGITPILFQKHGDEDPYRDLNDGVKLLAERAVRRVIDWQNKLAELGDRRPPIDDETIGEIEQALREEHTTRFFVAAARHPEWPQWLSDRGHLDRLFQASVLGPCDSFLAEWLADNYAVTHADALIGVAVDHAAQFNPGLWELIGRRIGLSEQIPARDFRRWTALLLPRAPTNGRSHILMWLAIRANALGLHELAAEIFLVLAKPRLDIGRNTARMLLEDAFEAPSGSDEEADEEAGEADDVGAEIAAEPIRFNATHHFVGDHYCLNEVWKKCIAPHLAKVHAVVLAGLCTQLEQMKQVLAPWRDLDSDWDSFSYSRSAIEPHEQDRFPKQIDVVIDAIREILAWLAVHSPSILRTWLEQLIAADAALLRRLAVHAVTLDATRSADEQLAWLLSHTGLFAVHEHHEVHRAIALLYTRATPDGRQVVIDEIQAYRAEAWGDRTAEDRTAREQFNWLAWLSLTVTGCGQLEEALAQIKAQHPHWELGEYPDFRHWSGSGWIGPSSPWSAAELLEQPAAQQLDALLAFQEKDRFDESGREGLLDSVREASQANPSWAMDLDDALSVQENWDSDLWAPLLQGLRAANLNLDQWTRVQASIERASVLSRHPGAIAELLYGLVKGEGKEYVSEVLPNANVVAWSLWQEIAPDNDDSDPTDWLQRAINRPAGDLMQFWLHGLSRQLQGVESQERVLPDEYRVWFEAALIQDGSSGGEARTVMASQLSFLYSLNANWTTDHLLPLFVDPDIRRFRQAWDGYLAWGQLNRNLAPVMQPAFVIAVGRLDELLEHRDRFVEFYTALAVFYSDDPTVELLPTLLGEGNEHDLETLAHQLGRFLDTMASPTRSDLWRRWLRQYWVSRLQAVPRALDTAEIRAMLGWLPHLDADYPEAVDLAIAAPAGDLGHSFILYELRESDLVARYPDATARLLIYLSNAGLDYQRADMRVVADRLPPLDNALQNELEEALARAGIR